MEYLKKFVVVVCSIIISLSTFAMSLASWEEMLAMKNVWIELTIVAGVVLAWLGQSPIKPKQ